MFVILQKIFNLFNGILIMSYIYFKMQDFNLKKMVYKELILNEICLLFKCNFKKFCDFK